MYPLMNKPHWAPSNLLPGPQNSFRSPLTTCAVPIKFYMNLPYFLRLSPSPLKHFRNHIFSFNSNPDNSSAGQWNWLPTDTPTEGHTLYRTHLELVEVEVMVCDGMGWFTRWGYQYWVNKAQQANDASMGILSTLSTLSTFSTLSTPSTFGNVNVRLPR